MREGAGAGSSSEILPPGSTGSCSRAAPRVPAERVPRYLTVHVLRSFSEGGCSHLRRTQLAGAKAPKPQFGGKETMRKFMILLFIASLHFAPPALPPRPRLRGTSRVASRAHSRSVSVLPPPSLRALGVSWDKRQRRIELWVEPKRCRRLKSNVSPSRGLNKGLFHNDE